MYTYVLYMGAKIISFEDTYSRDFILGWDHYHDTIESYDPALDKWDIVGEMGSSRSWLSCVGLTVKMESGTTAEEKS